MYEKIDLETISFEELLWLLRREGWMVAVHNDYRQYGEFHTFWLFTKGGLCAKGEAKSDLEALKQVLEQIRSIPKFIAEYPYWVR